MYGMINAAVVLPVMMSFGTIIYHDPVFEPYLPNLIKLTLVSSMVHQLCFSTFSSLPYSIGQVQDAGLIFLSAISSSFAKSGQKYGWEPSQLLATSTIGLSMCTACLGLGLMMIGSCRLARFVKVRLDEERSDELKPQLQATKIPRAHTPVQDAPPPQPPQ